MEITPEQTQIGKDNFNEVVGITRRDMMKATAAAGIVPDQGVVSGAAPHTVRPFAADQPVIAVVAVNQVRAGPAIDGVIRRAAIKRVR